MQRITTEDTHMTKTRIALAALLTLGVLAFAAAPALAKEVHVFSSSFGSAGSGPGQFKEPQGVAVNSSTSLTEPGAGDVYVIDEGNDRVERFSASGEYLGQFNGSAAPTGAFHFTDQQFVVQQHPGTQAVSGVAVDDSTEPLDPSKGDVYVTDTGHHVIDKFSPTGAYLGQLTGTCEKNGEPLPCAGSKFIPFKELYGVAVDPAGEVWVFQSIRLVGEIPYDAVTEQGEVDNYTDASANEFLASRKLALQGNNRWVVGPGFAVGPEDDLYIVFQQVDNQGRQEKVALRLDSAGAQLGAPDGRAEATAPAVDLSNNELYIDEGGTVGAFSHVEASPFPQIETFGSLTAATGIAVDSENNGVYVADNAADRVDAFGEITLADTKTEAATGVSETAATLHGTVNPVGIEVSSCRFEYRTEAEPAYGQHAVECSPKTPYTGTANVAVEATPVLLPNTTYHYRLAATNAQGTDYGSEEYFNGPEATFTTPGPPRITSISAVVNQTNKSGQTNATLKATILPGSPAGHETTYQFEYGETTSYGTSVPLTPADIGSGDNPVLLTAALSGLKVGTTYHYRVLASNEFSPPGGTASPDQTFATLPAALVALSASDVASTSATLDAEVNPLGTSTACESFQYVSAASFEASGYTTAAAAPCFPAALGSGEGYVEVAPQHIGGLTPGTVYHYRLLATNSLGTVAPEATFTTQGAGTSSALPDGRAYEQVSPPDKHGALFERIEQGIGGPVLGFEAAFGLPMQAAVAGNALATELRSPSEAEPQAFADFVPLLSTRGPSGWSSQVIAPPHAEPVGPSGNSTAGSYGEYRLFSGDLSQAIAQPLGATLLSPWASEPTPYLRTNYSGGNVSERCEGSYLSASSCFTPLVTAREGYANVPAGTAPFGEASEGRCRSAEGEHAELYTCGPRFLDATPDLGHVVLSAGPQLTEAPDEPNNAGNGRLYEWGGGQLQPLYLLPAGEGGSGVYAGGFNSDRPVSHQLANDGSVFFNYHGHLYLHDFAKEASVRLVAQAGAAEFLYASADGAKVLFRDAEQLTSTPGGGVYECRIVQDACGELLLTGLSVPGELLGGSEDASYLYFLGAGDRLDVGHYENGSWSATAGPVLPVGGTPAEVVTSHRISPNGRWFAFNSRADLTGYDTTDALSGQPDLEVYLYDAATGRTSCASCNPTGARPAGVNVKPPNESPDWVAAGVPEWADASSGSEGAQGGGGIDVYQPRYLSNSGRLFFDSSDALVPQDVNGTWDVYEYEPEGVPENEHACSSASTSGSDVFEPARSFAVEGRQGESGAGCVALISSGTSPEESSFIDASETGGDVFFLTEAQLSPTDTDTAPDVYDAHECTAESPCIAPPAAQPPPCETEAACKAAPTPQPSIYQAPPSATFNGPGNLPPEPVTGAGGLKKVTTKTVKCKRGFTKKKNKCFKNKKSKRAKKASHNRGTSR
jgi:hypothetical protein